MERSPTAGARWSGAEYTRALLVLVGDDDPLAVQAALVPTLRARVARLAPEQLRRPEAEGKWSVLEALEHLADAELVHGWRYRMVLAHDEPALPGYDQDAFARALRYRDGHVAWTLDELEHLRARNLRLLRSLGPDELARAGVHGERGREDLRGMIALAAGHDLVHRRQIERILARGGPEP